MKTIARFEETQAWQAARAKNVYDLTDQQAFSRDFSLGDQIRRAAISVISNTAQGFESRTDAQFINFLSMAKASAGKVRAQLYAALDQNCISEAQLRETYALAERCARQIGKFIRYLEAPSRPRRIAEDKADDHTNL